MLRMMRAPLTSACWCVYARGFWTTLGAEVGQIECLIEPGQFPCFFV